MVALAASLSAVEIHLTDMQAIKTTISDLDTGILWLDVAQTEVLQELHRRVNRELKERFGHTPANYDGDTYHFHMTIAIGTQPYSVYQKVVNSYESTRIDLRFLAKKLAMFVYDENFQLDRGYMTYKILPLGSQVLP